MWEVRAEGLSDSARSPLDLPVLFGRSRPEGSTETFFMISHKYISRSHLRISVACEAGSSESILKIEQLGKNPTFWGNLAEVLSAGAVVRLSSGSEASLTKRFLTFPRELNLPRISIEYRPLPEFVSDKRAQPNLIVAQSSLIISVDPADAEGEDEDVLCDATAGLFGAEGLLDKITMEKQASLVAVHVEAEAQPSASSQGNTVGLRTTKESVSEGTTSAYLKASRALTIGPGWGLDSEPVSMRTTVPPQTSSATQVVASVDLPTCTSAKAPVMGFWEWKAHLNGDDSTATNWKPYKKHVADKLEAVYRNPSLGSTVKIDDTYSVCFDEKTYGMIQYREDDHTRWRPIRRRGGDTVERKNAKRVRVINSHDSSDDDDGDGDIYKAAKKNVKKKHALLQEEGASSDGSDDYVDDGWLVGDEESDESDDTESTVSSLTVSSSDADEKRKKKKKAAKGKK